MHIGQTLNCNKFKLNNLLSDLYTKTELLFQTRKKLHIWVYLMMRRQK